MQTDRRRKPKYIKAENTSRCGFILAFSRDKTMTKENNLSDIEEIFKALRVSHENRDVDTLVQLYDERAVVFDMSPPLGRIGINGDAIKAWFDSWDGPILLQGRNIKITHEGNLAFVSALNRMQGNISGESQDLWFRSTLCLQKIGNEWKIVHDHTSVPFYMDGTDKAALDLKP